MRALHAVASTALLFALLLSAWAAVIWMPGRGSGDRKMILDEVRPTMQREIGGNIEFVVSVMRKDGQ